VNFKTHGAQQTKELGMRVGKKLKPGNALCLYGELGTGKTVFVKGIAQALGIEERQIASASFIIIAEHEGVMPLYHIDLYRIDSADEIDELGLYEYIFGNGIAVIEWAERLPETLPEAIIVKIFYAGENERQIDISGIDLGE
jgi:tRNA threonylcarbamoyladenosine biosynthesis protein TsaE